MSLENAAVAEAPTAGQETATSQDAVSSDLDTRFEGIVDPDELEPEVSGTSDPEADPSLTDEPPAEETVADPLAGYEDFEMDGKVYKIPSEIKDGYMRNADYTRKTQAVAEQVRQVQAREQEIAQKFQQSEQEFNAWVELAQVSNQLKPVESIDWMQEYQRLLNDPKQHDDPLAWQSDINQFNAIKMQAQQLQEKRQSLINHTRQFEQQRSEQTQQQTAKRIQDTLQFAKTEIKGWTPELDAKIADFATNVLKYSTEVLMQGMTPENYHTLYLAHLGHQSQLRQQTAKPAAPAVSPTSTVSAKTHPQNTKAPDDMSEAEFFAYREAQIARRK